MNLNNLFQINNISVYGNRGGRRMLINNRIRRNTAVYMVQYDDRIPSCHLRSYTESILSLMIIVI